MQLVDRDSGAPLAQYLSRGRAFSPGLPGSRYAIRLTNPTAGRLLVVLSVDGVNAITGDTAGWSQSGYVLAPGESADITGWRKSDDRIAAFEFTALGDSYAARTGRPANVGVVGAAVFTEAPPVPVVYQAPVVSEPRRSLMPQSPRFDAGNSAEAAAPAPAPAPSAKVQGSSSAAAAGELSRRAEVSPLADVDRTARDKLGTGHGASEWSPIAHTAFERRSPRPDQVLEIHYDSQANLMAAGIMPRPMAALPRSFPDAGTGGYVPDPPRRW
jgi:hypothetical protein